MNSRLVPLLSFLAVAAVATTASAEVPPPQKPPPVIVVEQPGQPVPVEPVTPDTRWHEGFVLRVGLGFGGMVDDFGGPFGWLDATASGGSGAAELLIGGSFAPGWLVGGAVIGEQVVDPSVEVQGVPVDDDVGVGTFVLVGPAILFYPHPDGGFSLQGAVGFARLDIADTSGERKEHQPLGGGASVAAGYEWWIGDEWSFGGQVRLSGGTLRDDGITHRVGAFSVLATITYN